MTGAAIAGLVVAVGSGAGAAVAGASALSALAIGAISGGTTALSRVLRGPGSASVAQEGRLANVSSNQQPIGPVYGETRIGGMISDTRVDPASTDDRYLVRVVALALGSENGAGIEDVIDIFADGNLAVDDPVIVRPPSEPAMSTLRVTSTFISPEDGAEKLEYALHLGGEDQTANNNLESRFSEYDADTRGRGVCYVVLGLTYDNSVYRTNVPRFTFLVRGNRLYDPRDPTGGPDGDGFVWDAADSTAASPINGTTKHPGRNPALAVLDLLTSQKYGLGAAYPERDGGSAVSEIDEQSFIDAANFCDEDVQDGAGGTQRRFTCDGAVDTGRPLARNLEELLTACRGRLVYQGGKFRLYITQDRAAETFELDESTIVGDWSFSRLGAEGVANRVNVTFVNAAKDYQPDDIAWPEAGDANAFLSDDNDYPAERDLDLPYTQDAVRAQQIGMVELKESRADAVVGVTAVEEALKLQVGDVVPLSHETPGFSSKKFWVVAVGPTPDGHARLQLREFDASAYTLDPQSQPSSPPGTSLPDVTSIGVPTGVSATSDGTTTITVDRGTLGIIKPRIRLDWTAPADEPFLDHYEAQIREDGESQWDPLPNAQASDTRLFTGELKSQTTYDVRIRSVNTVGVPSSWVEVSETTTVTVSTTVTSLVLDGDSEDGSVDVRVEAAGNVASYRYAFTTGTDPARPTDAAVEGGTVRTISGTDEFTLAAGTVSPGERIRFRIAPYENANGTGPNGATDHAAFVERAWKYEGQVQSGNLTIDAAQEQILFGAATAPGSGVGIFLGLSGGVYHLRAGDPNNDFLHWDGSTLTVVGDITATTISADSGTIGGWSLTATTIESASNNIVLDSANELITVGSGVTLDGSAGSITATAGAIGGWSLSSSTLSSTNVTIDSANEQIVLGSKITLDGASEHILIGDATTPTSGVGGFLGLSGANYEFRFGDPNDKNIHWTGTDLLLTGLVVDETNIFDRSIQMRHRFAGSHDNLVANPGFEQDDTALAEWTADDAGATGWSTDTSADVRSGSVAASFDPAGQGVDAADLFATNLPIGSRVDGIAVAQGDEMYAECFVRKKGAGTPNRARIGFNYYDRTGVFVSSRFGQLLTPTQSYQKITVSGTVPAGVAFAVVRISVPSDGNTETLLFDDVLARRKVIGDFIVDGTIVADHVAADTLTGNEVTTMDLTAKTFVADTGTVGGWTLSGSSLSSGAVDIDASAEEIRLGSATAFETGAGIFLAGTGDAHFGDPAAEFLSFNASTGELTHAGSTFIASSITMDGTLAIEAAAGVPVIEISDSGAGGDIQFNESVGGAGRAVIQFFTGAIHAVDGLHLSCVQDTERVVIRQTDVRDTLIVANGGTTTRGSGIRFMAADDGTPALTRSAYFQWDPDSRRIHLDDADLGDAFVFDLDDKRLGIGTSSPNATLHVAGGAKIEGDVTWTDSAFTWLPDTSNGADTKLLQMGGGGSISTSRGAYLILRGADHVDGGGATIRGADSGGVVLGGGTVEVEGDMGINGIASPQEALHVAGVIKSQKSGTGWNTNLKLRNHSSEVDWAVETDGTFSSGGLRFKSQDSGTVALTLNKAGETIFGSGGISGDMEVTGAGSLLLGGATKPTDGGDMVVFAGKANHPSNLQDFDSGIYGLDNGEVHVIDFADNKTQISPHDENGRWVQNHRVPGRFGEDARGRGIWETIHVERWVERVTEVVNELADAAGITGVDRARYFEKIVYETDPDTGRKRKVPAELAA